jgi:hypothetical protein
VKRQAIFAKKKSLRSEALIYDLTEEKYIGCGSDSKNCGSDIQIAGNKKPHRPLVYGALRVEAEVGIEPA